MYRFSLSLLALLAIAPVVQAVSFSDVSPSYRYREAIDYIAERGIVQGYSDGTYKPNQQINRAEFTKIIIEAKFPGQAAGQRCFSDVRDEWFAPYVCFAKAQGIIGGNPDGTFRPGNNINTAEAYKIVLEAMTTNPKYNETGSQWFGKYLDYAMANRFNYANRLDPGHLVTRGEMGQMIYLILDDAGIGEYELAILNAVNTARAQQGLAPLRYNRVLEQSAYLHAKDMGDNGYFDHNSRDGRTPDQRMAPYLADREWSGFSVGENIWMWEQSNNTLDPASLANKALHDPEAGWMQSPAHRANILHPEFTELGVGFYRNAQGHVFFVQNFGWISFF